MLSMSTNPEQIESGKRQPQEEILKPLVPSAVKKLVDLAVIVILWGYFLFGFALFFLPFYLIAYCRSKNREVRFQQLNHRFFRSFLILCRLLVPGLQVSIQDSVPGIRSSIVLCNHVSYLDPLFLISLFAKQKTIVKNSFLKVPLFGWLIKHSGYLPSTARGNGFPLMIKQLTEMTNYLATGGNLFVFPEGTRSRDGRIGKFEIGAFGIAMRCRAPIKLIFIQNTNVLFGPGHFLFNTCVPNTIRIEMLDQIDPDYDKDAFDPDRLREQILSVYQQRNQRLLGQNQIQPDGR